MKPPPDQSLDIRGTRTDLPARAQPKYGVGMAADLRWSRPCSGCSRPRWPGSSPASFGKWTSPLSIAGDPQLHLVVPLGADGAGGRLAGAALPVRAAAACCCAIVGPHPGRRSCSRSRTSPACRACTGGWPATRGSDYGWWTAGPARGVPLPRLGDDDLLGHRRPQSRAPLLPRVARARGARRAARDQAGRGAAQDAAAAAASRTSCSTRCTRSRR